MPQIKEYTQRTSPEGGFSTVQISPESAAQEGRAIAQLGQAVSGVAEAGVKAYQTSQLTDASVRLSEFNSAQTIKLKELSEKGEVDPDKFIQEYNEDAQKMSEDFGGPAKNYLTKGIAQSKAHLTEYSHAAKAEQTATKIKEDAGKRLSADSSRLMNDYTAYPSVMNDYNNFVDTLQLPPKIASKLRQEGQKDLAVGAIRGQYRLDPIATRKSLEKGNWNGILDSDQIKSMIGETNAELSAREAEAARSTRLQKEQKEAVEDASMNKYLVDVAAGSGKYSRLDLMRDPTIAPEKKMSLTNFMTSLDKKTKAVSVKSSMNEAYRKIILPDGDPNKIITLDQLKPYTEDLDAKDTQWLVGKLTSSNTPEEKVNARLKATFYNAAKSALGIDPLSKVQDPERDAQLSALTVEFETQFAKKRQEGLTPAELLDANSKNSMYPMINNYRRSLNERLASSVKNLQGSKGAVKQPPVDEAGKKLPPAEFLKKKKENK